VLAVRVLYGTKSLARRFCKLMRLASVSVGVLDRGQANSMFLRVVLALPGCNIAVVSASVMPANHCIDVFLGQAPWQCSCAPFLLEAVSACVIALRYVQHAYMQGQHSLVTPRLRHSIPSASGRNLGAYAHSKFSHVFMRVCSVFLKAKGAIAFSENMWGCRACHIMLSRTPPNRSLGPRSIGSVRFHASVWFTSRLIRSVSAV